LIKVKAEGNNILFWVNRASRRVDCEIAPVGAGEFFGEKAAFAGSLRETGAPETVSNQAPRF